MCVNAVLQGASLHALRQLEEELLKRFEVPSFGELQLPAGCKTLLSALESQDELAAALTGYADAWDCGAVPLEDVLRVVTQALINLRHGARGRNKTHSEGGHGRPRYLLNVTAVALEPHEPFAVADGRQAPHFLLHRSCLPQKSHKGATKYVEPPKGFAASSETNSANMVVILLLKHVSPAGAITRAVSAALCSHFKVAHVLRLGYGPVQGLMREAEETAGLAATPSGPPQGADATAPAITGGTACWSALALTSNGKLGL